MGNRKKNVIRLSFAMLLPILFMCIVYAVIGIYPFGNKTLFTNDMSFEYVAFFSKLGHILRGNGDVFYSFSKVIGGDMVGLFGYYLLSPFNLLAVFFRPEQMHLFVLLITLLKIGSAGLSMNLYLETKGTHSLSLLFSTAYAMMSYNIAYQQNIMWLDGVILLPLIIWGLDELLAHKNLYLYTAALTAGLVTSFYIGYMLCVFSVLYFGVHFLFQWKDKMWQERKSIIGRYVMGSLFAGGLAAIVLLPTVLSLQGGKSEIHLGKLLKFTLLHKPWEVLMNLLPGYFDIQGGTFKTPNIYCGLFVVLFAVVYFIFHKNNGRRKAADFLLILFLFISLLFENFERVWHGLELPTGYPHRYSFIFSFLLISAAYTGWEIVIKLLQKRERAVMNILTSFLCVIAIGESILNAGLILKCFSYQDAAAYRQAVAGDFQYTKKLQETDSSFYRMEDTHGGFSMNKPMLLDYRGLASSYSGEKQSTKKLAGNLGMNEKATWIAYHDQMSVGMESFLNMKYLISGEKNKEMYRLIEDKEGRFVYENPYMLPLGVMTDASIFEANIDNRDMFAIQNQIWDSILRTKGQLYVPIQAKELYREDDGVSYEFAVEKEDIIYTNFFEEGLVENCDIYANGEKLNSFSPEKMPYRLGRFQKGDIIKVDIRSTKNNINWYDLYFYYENLSVLDKNIPRVRGEAFQIAEFNEHYFRGTIENHSGQERYALFTIPNDAGWNIVMDGKETAANTVLDSLICIKIPDGEHELILRFIPQGLKLGGAISAIILVLVFLYCKTASRLSGNYTLRN